MHFVGHLSTATHRRDDHVARALPIALRSHRAGEVHHFGIGIVVGFRRSQAGVVQRTVGHLFEVCFAASA
jgi:hypothetical protein